MNEEAQQVEVVGTVQTEAFIDNAVSVYFDNNWDDVLPKMVKITKVEANSITYRFANLQIYVEYDNNVECRDIGKQKVGKCLVHTSTKGD